MFLSRYRGKAFKVHVFSYRVFSNYYIFYMTKVLHTNILQELLMTHIICCLLTLRLFVVSLCLHPYRELK